MKKTIITILALVFGIFLCYKVYYTEENQINRADEQRKEVIHILGTEISTDRHENEHDTRIIQNLQNQIQERDNNIKRNTACKSINETLLGTLGEPVYCDTVPVLLSPDELFYGVKMADNPYISQHEEEHFKKQNGGVLATDVATGFKAELYAPDYLAEVKAYRVEVKEDDLLGNYVRLYWSQDGSEYFWIIAHIRTRLETGDIVYTGQRIGEMDLSGYTTGYHLHQELWKDGINISYSTRSKVLDNKRAGVYDTPEGNTIYFTSYDLGDVSQNDDSPCIGASGRDLCEMAAHGVQTVALTVDMRNKLGIELGDVISLIPQNDLIKKEPSIEVKVEDEMNQRFRYACIEKAGYCIKGDIAKFNGESRIPSGIYTIVK